LQWFGGVFLAGIPLVYGVLCLLRGATAVFGRGGSSTFTGEAGVALAIAYLAIGAFLHFHFFWGLSDRLWRGSQPAKVASLLVFLPALAYGLYHGVFPVL
jgi:hypothetical protein